MANYSTYWHDLLHDETAGHLDLDLFPGEHSWGGNRSVAFFKNQWF